MQRTLPGLRIGGEHNIRVNAISAGPLNTLAARGVSGFTSFREQMGHAAPLRRNIEQSEVGDVALFLSSHYCASHHRRNHVR